MGWSECSDMPRNHNKYSSFRNKVIQSVSILTKQMLTKISRPKTNRRRIMLIAITLRQRSVTRMVVLEMLLLLRRNRNIRQNCSILAQTWSARSNLRKWDSIRFNQTESAVFKLWMLYFQMISFQIILSSTQRICHTTFRH